MTKLRAPESIEDAVFQAVALLGEPLIEAAAGVSASLVRKWSDPDDQAHRIGLHQALAIDEALVRAGHAPVFGALFDRTARGELQGEDGNPVAAALRMTVEATSIMDRVDQAMADGLLDSAEIVAIRAKVGALRKRISRLERALYFKTKGGRI